MKQMLNGAVSAVFLVGATVAGIAWELYATVIMWRGGIIWPVNIHVWGPHHGLAVLMVLVGWEIVAGLAYGAAVLVLTVLLIPVLAATALFRRKRRAEA